MIIKNITAGALKDFIHSPEYKKLSVVPITRHRALSHINNPRVSSDDVVLLLAYSQETLVGYLGILADKITLKDSVHKIGWMSCIWVDEHTRGQGVAKILMNEAFRVWGNKILATQYTPEARRSYVKSGLFSEGLPYSGMRGYLRFNLGELLPPKKRFFKIIKPLLKTADSLLNVFNDLRIAIFTNKKITDSKIEYINEIDEETSLLIEKFQKKNIAKRHAGELNWIIKNPWLLSAPGNDITSSRYFFSSLEKQHFLMNIKIYDDKKQLKAFIMLLVRGKNIKIPYCFFNPEDTGEIANLIYMHMKKMQLNMLTVFHPVLKNYMLTHNTPFIYKKVIKQEYLLSKIFQNDLGDDNSFLFQDGDGDCAFT